MNKQIPHLIAMFLLLTLSKYGNSSPSDFPQVAEDPKISNSQRLKPTFSSLKKYIFQPKCFECHGTVDGYAGVKLGTYKQIRSQVVPKDAQASRLYWVMSRGTMPPEPGPTLTEDELAALYKWIQAGAKNN